MSLELYLKGAISVAQKAGAYLKTHFHDTHTIASKSHINDLVTECDSQAELLIKKELAKLFPHSSFHCEESGIETHHSPLTWIIDPLDGTVNFAKNIPFFCVSIGLLLDQTIACGVIFSPMTDELFYATRGGGAFLNGHKLTVSLENNLIKAFGATGFPYRVQDHLAQSLHPLKQLLTIGVPLRRLGSAALDLAYTAAGRFDLFFEAHLEPWDYAAGSLILQEAGGMITDYHNKPLTYKKASSVLATNGHLHLEMLTKVAL